MLHKGSASGLGRHLKKVKLTESIAFKEINEQISLSEDENRCETWKLIIIEPLEDNFPIVDSQHVSR